MGRNDVAFRQPATPVDGSFGNLMPKRRISGRKIVAQRPRPCLCRGGRHQPIEPFDRHLLRTRNRQAELHDLRVMSRLKHLRHQFADTDASDQWGGSRSLRLRRHLARGPDVKPGLWPRFDALLAFKVHVGLEHRRNTHIHLRAEFANRRQPFPCPQSPLIDQLGNMIRHSIVEQIIVSRFLSQHSSILTSLAASWQIQLPENGTGTDTRN